MFYANRGPKKGMLATVKSLDSNTLEFYPQSIANVELDGDALTIYTVDGGWYFTMSRADADKIAKIEIIDKATADAIEYVREYMEAVREAPLFWVGLDLREELEDWVLCNQAVANDPSNPIEAKDHTAFVKKAKELYEVSRDQRITARDDRVYSHVTDTLVTWVVNGHPEESAMVCDYLSEFSDSGEYAHYDGITKDDLIKDYLLYKEMAAK